MIGEERLKALAVAFSARDEGNCKRLCTYCLGRLQDKGWQTELLSAFDLRVTPCENCRYECFKGESCPIDDDVPKTYEMCREADVVIFAVPTYGGHLASVYFAFAERAQSVYKSFADFEADFLRKVNFIIIGNLSAGGDMALHEALYGFTNRDFWPETLLFSSREYGQSSLEGTLVDNSEVRGRLDRFVEMVLKKYEGA
jgi:multimeric flavodoxin WrbA